MPIYNKHCTCETTCNKLQNRYNVSTWTTHMYQRKSLIEKIEKVFLETMSQKFIIAQCIRGYLKYE